MAKLFLILIFVSGLVSSNDHFNLFKNTQKLSNISYIEAPKVEELDQRKLRLMCEGKMAACFRSDQPDTVFIDKALSKDIKSLALVGIYADYQSTSFQALFRLGWEGKAISQKRTTPSINYFPSNKFIIFYYAFFFSTAATLSCLFFIN